MSSGSFCLVLIALRVGPVVSVRCCALTMNVNITVLAMANGKAVPQIGSLSRIGG